MSKDTTTTWPHQDLLNDNKVNVAELPAKVQEKLAKFPSLTDKDAQEAMDEQLYGAIDDFLEAKAKEEKSKAVKAKMEEHKKKKSGIDVSKADTAKSDADKLKEEEDRKKKEAEAKPRTVYNAIYPGRK